MAFNSIMAIHATRTQQSLKTFATLKIPECPLDPKSFSQFRRKFESELETMDLTKFLTHSFRELVLETWKRNEPDKYDYERELSLKSDIPIEEIDYFIFDERCTERSYDGGTNQINITQVLMRAEEAGETLDEGNLRKLITKIKNKKAHFVVEFNVQKATTQLALVRAMEKFHSDVLVDSECKNDPYKIYQKLLEKQMQHSANAKSIFVALSDFHSLKMETTQTALENFNNFVLKVMEKAELLNSLQPGIITEPQKIFRLIDGIPDGKQKEHAKLIIKTRPDISFAGLVSIMSEEFNSPTVPLVDPIPSTTANAVGSHSNDGNHSNDKRKTFHPKWNNNRQTYTGNGKDNPNPRYRFNNRRGNHRYKPYRPNYQRESRLTNRGRPFQTTNEDRNNPSANQDNREYQGNHERKRRRQYNYNSSSSYTSYNRPGNRSNSFTNNQGSTDHVNTVMDLDTGCDRVFHT